MKAFGIINFEGPNVKVSGLGDYRPVPAFSFFGRYRMIDFMISNMTNSGIENLQVYMNGETRSLIEHIGTGQHYNINSKTGRVQLLTKHPLDQGLYNHDVNAFLYNLEAIEEVNADYVVIAPSYIIRRQTRVHFTTFTTEKTVRYSMDFPARSKPLPVKATMEITALLRKL